METVLRNLRNNVNDLLAEMTPGRMIALPVTASGRVFHVAAHAFPKYAKQYKKHRNPFTLIDGVVYRAVVVADTQSSKLTTSSVKKAYEDIFCDIPISVAEVLVIPIMPPTTLKSARSSIRIDDCWHSLCNAYDDLIPEGVNVIAFFGEEFPDFHRKPFNNLHNSRVTRPVVDFGTVNLFAGVAQW